MTGQQIDRDRLRELAENATPGPWEAWWAMDDDGELTVAAGTALPDEDGLLPGSYVSTDVILTWDDIWPEDGGEQRHADAEFIAAAREAVPALLDENAALRARIEAVRDVLNRAEAAINRHPAYTWSGQRMDPIVNGADIRRALDGQR